MQSQLTNFRQVKSIMPIPTRRQVLWNVVEPGDPYDIKRSMIAQMPGDKKIFMGNHLQLVCLLQAAEIERLLEFLDDYRLKLRQIERSNLDRHSYEIQIKELTSRLTEEESLRNQNGKLKQYIIRQTNEIQELQRSGRGTRQFQDNFKVMYDKSLERINSLNIQNRDLKQLSEDYRIQIQNYSARLQALQKAKNKQIDDLKLNYAQYSKQSSQSNINGIRLQYDGEIKRLEFELKRLKQINDAKNSQINQISHRYEAINDQLNRVKRNDNSYGLEKQIVEYQQRFVLFGQQIQRLNILLRDYISKLQDAELKKRQLQRRIQKYEFENREAQGKYRSSLNELAHFKQLIKKYEEQAKSKANNNTQRVAREYQIKISDYSKEIDVINNKLKAEIQNSKKLRDDVERLAFQNSRVKLLEGENAKLRQGNYDLVNLRKKIAEVENKNSILSQQIDRLNYTLKSKDDMLERTRGISGEYETAKSQFKDLQRTLTTRYQSEISRLKVDYQQKLQYVNRSAGSQIQVKSQLLETQRERLQQLLKNKNEESEKQRGRIYQLQTLINRNQLQTSTRLKTYQANLANLKRENQQLYIKVKNLSESDRKAYEYQNKLSQYQKQLERLTGLLKTREEEIITLRNRLRDTEGTNQKYQSEFSRKIMDYQQTNIQIRKENQELRRKINQIVVQTNKKLVQASQELERIGKALRLKNQQKTALDSKISQMAQQYQLLNQNSQKISYERDDLRNKLNEYEYKMNSHINDSTTNIRSMTQQNQTLKKQINDIKTYIANYQAEANRRITGLDQNNASLTQTLNQYKSKMMQLSQEGERVSSLLKQKSEAYAGLQNNFNGLSSEYEKIKRSFKEYELSVNSKMEGEVIRKYRTYEEQIQMLTREKEEIIKKINQYENKLKLLSVQFEKLNANLNQVVEDNQNLKKQLAQKDNLVGSFQVEVNQKITKYQTNILNITNANQELQRKLADSERLLYQRVQENRALFQQNQAIKKQYKEYEYSVSQKFDIEVTKKYANYQQSLAKLSQQNDELRRKIQQIGGDLSRRLMQGQNKYAVVGQQNQRIKSNLIAVSQERDALKKRLEQYGSSISSYEAEVQKRLGEYQKNITGLTQERGEVRALLIDYQSKIALLSQEVERLGSQGRQLQQQNQKIKKELNQKHNSVSNFQLQISRKVNGYQQNLAYLQKQNQDLKRKLSQYEQRIIALSQQIQRMNTAYKSKQQQMNKYDINFKTVISQNEMLKKQIRQTQIMITNKYQVQVRNKFTAYEQNITVISKENDDLRRKLQDLSGDSNRRNQELQIKINQAAQEIQRLNDSLKNKQEESARLQAKSRTINNQLEGWKRQYNDLEIKFQHTYEFEVTKKYSLYEQNIADISKRCGDLEGKLIGATQQIQRLNNILRLKVQESTQLSSTLKNREADIEEFNRRVRENEMNLSQNAMSLKKQSDQLRRKNQQLQYSSRQRAQDNDRRLAEYQNKFSTACQQIQRLNKLLKAKSEELQLTKKQFKQYEYSVTQKLQYDLKNKHSQYQNSLGNINKENQELRRKLQEANQLGRKLIQYQSKIALMSQEIERLNSMLRSKSDELEAVKRQFKQYELTVNQKLQYDVKSKFTQYQSSIAISAKQNDELRRKLQEYGDLSRKLAEYQNKLVIVSQQNQRLTSIIKSKHEDLSKLDGNWKSITKQNEQLRRRLQQISDVNKRIPEYQAKIKQILQQHQKLQFALRNKTDELNSNEIKLRQSQQEIQNQKRQIKQFQISITNKYQTQINRKITTYEQTIASLNRQKQDFNRNQKQYESNIFTLTQQLQKIKSQLQSTNDQFQKVVQQLNSIKLMAHQKITNHQSQYIALQQSYANLTREYQNSKKHLQEYEISIRKLYTEFERLQGIINELKRERESLVQKNHNLSQQINRLTLENKDLQKQTEDIRLRLTDQNSLQKRITQHLSLMVILFAEIESLRQRVKEKEKEVEVVRRSSLAPNIL